MRPPPWRWLILSLPLLVTGLVAPPAQAADPDLNGSWKVILVGPFVETDLLLVGMKDHAGKIEAEVKDSQQFPQPPQVLRVDSKGGVVRMALKIVNIDAEFSGKPVKDGVIAG